MMDFYLQLMDSDFGHGHDVHEIDPSQLDNADCLDDNPRHIERIGLNKFDEQEAKYEDEEDYDLVPDGNQPREWDKHELLRLGTCSDGGPHVIEIVHKELWRQVHRNPPC
ncbi:hypothetical protein M441DRAFT_90421 [Trichoderma asperellum CBS 433.97]|uniref:Uncharacterized protein n=1 Tax=Trichoderma asperellum (strain ATCC 204424 / CBS 433.97 / NBRC 101777) TaxID=1042311 RepID=A0A2T3Z5L5_TRIA4|nr:hypothetical protein M441DRAFT_90421 [Trichoderma asperellum CBS 433.97]PTB40084.1 hypothetical protein M441DRAFT_90421 [Trichoderma asperellum CBS 433.97]